MIDQLKIFNVTNRADPLLDELHCVPAAVGKNQFPKNYLKCKKGKISKVKHIGLMPDVDLK